MKKILLTAALLLCASASAALPGPYALYEVPTERSVTIVVAKGPIRQNDTAIDADGDAVQAARPDGGRIVARWSRTAVIAEVDACTYRFETFTPSKHFHLLPVTCEGIRFEGGEFDKEVGIHITLRGIRERDGARVYRNIEMPLEGGWMIDSYNSPNDL